MTTPERLRRRQRRESAALAVLALALVVVFIYFRGQDAAQEQCINGYFSAQAKTQKVRSELVEDESRATRILLLKGTSAKSRAEFQQARMDYVAALKDIDRKRDENPVQDFPEGLCG